MKHRRTLVPVLAAVALGLAACGTDDETPVLEPEVSSDDDEGVVTEEEPEDNVVPVERRVELTDPEGSILGSAVFTDSDQGVMVHVEVSGMTEGFHPMALYEVGLCEPENTSPTDPAAVGDFLSAGTVIGLGEAVEGTPAGALPPLLVTERGAGEQTSLTGPTDLTELLDEDGSALIIQESVDTIADLPLFGEGGSRIACAVVGD